MAKFLVLAVNDSKPTVREYKRRKFHTKDRLGCLSCREKRVKLVRPNKPICARCSRTGRDCWYDATVAVVQRPTKSHPTPWLAPWDGGAVEFILKTLLHHSRTTVAPVFGDFLDNSLWEVICGHPYLLAAILAVSASHLRHHTAGPFQHHIAQGVLLSTALKSYRLALVEPLTARRSDAILMTSALLNNLAFSNLESLDPLDSWVFSDAENRLSWISIQMGIKPLLMAAERFKKETILKAIYEASNGDTKTFSSGSWSLDQLPPHWIRLAVGLDKLIAGKPEDGPYPVTHPFLETAAILTLVTHLPSSLDLVFLYVQFFRALDSRFVELLYLCNEGALWFLGYWLGLIARLKMWWCDERARRAWLAIREYIAMSRMTERDGDEGDMRRALMADYESVRPSDAMYKYCNKVPH